MPEFHFKESWKRSLAKTATYRIVIIALDFTVLYILTHGIEIAIGFTILSNTYTSIGYFLHERAWDKVKWGKHKRNAAPQKRFASKPPR